MSVYTLRPDAIVSGSATPSAGTVNACLSDASDATYITALVGTLVLGTANPTVAGGEFPDRIVPSIRVTMSSDPTGDISWASSYLTSNDPLCRIYLGGYSTELLTATTFTGSAATRKYTTAMLNDLRFTLSSLGDNTAFARALDAWVTVCTQKVATATIANKTETQDTSPTVVATTTADIDSWQASFEDARTMRLEVQIELNGSGYGTGTVMDTQALTVAFDSTVGTGRTVATNVTSNVPLPNGVYNVYSRVGRQRTMYLGEWEYGAWSSAATLTMNATPPATPTMTLTTDQTGDRILVKVTPVATTGYSNPTIDVERQDSYLPFTQPWSSDMSVDTNADGIADGYAVTEGVTATRVQDGTTWWQRLQRANSSGSTVWGVLYPDTLFVLPTTGTRYVRLRARLKGTVPTGGYVSLAIFRYDYMGGSYVIRDYLQVICSITAASAEYATVLMPLDGAVAVGPQVITGIPDGTSCDTYVTDFLLECFDAGGDLWVPVRGMTDIAGAFGVEKNLGFDYESVRGLAPRYRAHVSAFTTPYTNTSLWAVVTATAITATGWNLKCPETPALNILNAAVTGEPSEAQSEDVGVFRAIGRELPVVVGGTLTGYDGEYTLVLSASAQWTTLTELIEAQQVVLVESPFGWRKYVRVLGNAATISGTTTTPRRVVRFGYVEVAAP